MDTILLDNLADDNHGASAYVRPAERLDEAVSAFYAKVQAPVLADLKIDFGNILVSDLYPDPLPDLFAGSQLVLVGRYRGGGDTVITLKGTVNGESRAFEYGRLRFRESGGDDFIPRLWATRKIGYLLNQIRLKGENEEWVKAIVNLSVRYGIVTPYTSYLITEDDILSTEGRERVVTDAFEALHLAPPAPASGGGAVTASQDQAALEAADAAAAPANEYAQSVKIVGARTFINIDGVWTDTQFDPSAMKTTPVQFASDDYFALIAARPDLSAAFALGERVIVIDNGLAYEVVAGDAPPISLPETATPKPQATGQPVAIITPTPAVTEVPPTSTPKSGGPCSSAFIVLSLVAMPFVVRSLKRR